MTNPPAKGEDILIQSKTIDKELAEKLMKIKGESRGVCLKTDMSFFLKEKGREGLARLEQELKTLGYPLKYEEINSGDFYPIGLDILNMLLIWKLFNFDNTKIKEMGYQAPKVSIFMKLFMKYFFSLQETLRETPEMWRRHYTLGQLEVGEVNQEENYVILRIKNFNIHPIYCLVLEGYFAGVCKMVVQCHQIHCQETKCSFRGDQYHEFLITWQ